MSMPSVKLEIQYVFPLELSTSYTYGLFGKETEWSLVPQTSVPRKSQTGLLRNELSERKTLENTGRRTRRRARRPLLSWEQVFRGPLWPRGTHFLGSTEVLEGHVGPREGKEENDSGQEHDMGTLSPLPPAGPKPILPNPSPASMNLSG